MFPNWFGSKYLKKCWQNILLQTKVEKHFLHSFSLTSVIKRDMKRLDTEEGRNEKVEKYDPAEDNLRGLALMAAQITEEEELGKIQEEWQLAAEIMNQFFMIFYIMAAFLTFVVTFINAPGIIFSHPEQSMDDIVRVY